MKQFPVSWAPVPAGFAAALLAVVFGMQARAQQAPGLYTDAQATAGGQAFAQSCAACHQRDLSGSGEAPALTGARFAGGWGNGTSHDLFQKVRLTMPLGAPNSLPEDTYADIVAFLLKANGAPAGSVAFTPEASVSLRGVLTGRAPANILSAAPAASPVAPPARAPRRRVPAPAKTGLTVSHVVPHYTMVTEEMMLSPPSSDWLMHYGNYAGWSHSPLDQINTANVGQLQLRWVWSMDEGERQQITPLVHDGVMFVSNNRTNKVQALDAATGELIWENFLGPDLSFQQNATRTMALYGDKLFYPSTDARLYALDARTGKIDWQIQVTSYGNDKIGSLTVAKGKVIVGITRCDDHSIQDRCFLAAYDPKDGHLLWKFYTVAFKGDPVGGDSWGSLTDDQRAGAEAWIPGTYDPKLNLVFYGTGQAKGTARAMTEDGLFQNSTIALDVDTGKLQWYHQDAPDVGLDLDEVYEKTLIDDGARKTLVTVGKKGIMWKLDRTTGKFLDYRQTVFQNVFTAIDPKTGRGTYRADILSQKSDSLVASCPSQEGGHDWPTTSYDPGSGLIVLPLSQTCVINGGGQKFYEMPGTDGNLGRISAYDAKSFRPVWSFQQKTPFLTGVMTTAGGLGFVGDWDRVLRAFDVKTGKTLWKTRLGTTAQGFITTFEAGGEQFVAVPTGYNGGSPEQKPTTMLSGELNRPATGHAVYVFALPGKL
jgi:alcohol dehydrogenase (cytochrome c)